MTTIESCLGLDYRALVVLVLLAGLGASRLACPALISSALPCLVLSLPALSPILACPELRRAALPCLPCSGAVCPAVILLRCSFSCLAENSSDISGLLSWPRSVLSLALRCHLPRLQPCPCSVCLSCIHYFPTLPSSIGRYLATDFWHTFSCIVMPCLALALSGSALP